MSCNQTVSLRQIVNYLTFRNLRRILDTRGLSLTKTSVLLKGELVPVIRLGQSPILIFRAPFRFSIWDTQYGPGDFIDDSKLPGVLEASGDLVKLEAYLGSSEVAKRWLFDCVASNREGAGAVKLEIDRDYSEERALKRLIERLGIDPQNPQNSPKSQKRWPAQWTQVPFKSETSPNLVLKWTGEDGEWPSINPARLPFLGFPHRTFELLDPEGRVRQLLAHWNTPWERPFLQSFTLWRRDRDPRYQRWMLLNSLLPVFPYEGNLIGEFPEARIIVVDDCNRCRQLNRSIDDRNLSTQFRAVAWPGNLPGAAPVDTDWSALSGRSVICVTDSNATCVKDCVALFKAIRRIGPSAITFQLCSTQALTAGADVLLDTILVQKHLSIEEFAAVALQDYAVTIDDESSAVRAWKIGDPSPQGNMPYLLRPFIRAGTITILVSHEGVGKTWFAALLGYAVAGGTKFLDRWSAEKPAKVLFIRTERNDGLPDRLNRLHRIYGAELANVAVFPESDFGKAVDLTTDEGWASIAEQVDKADLIFLDSLGNIISFNDSKDWRRLKHHLDKLIARRKAVVILHHLGKDGSLLGSKRPLIDADQVIRLTRLFDNGGLVEFPKRRDDDRLGKDSTSFEYRWKSDDAEDKVTWSTKYVEDVTKITWDEEIPDEHPARRLNEVYLAENFKEREVKLIRDFAATDRSRTRTTKALSGVLGVSPETTLPIINKLIKHGAVVKEGRGRSSCYRLSDDFKEKLYH